MRGTKVGAASTPVLKAIHAFKKIGANCRKVGNEYVCEKGSIVAVISPIVENIKVKIPGGFRLWYSDFTLEEDPEKGDEYITEGVKHIMGAKYASIRIEPSPDVILMLEYDIKDADKAAKAMKEFFDKDLWLAITNIKGDIRLLKGNKQLDLEKWLEELEK